MSTGQATKRGAQPVARNVPAEMRYRGLQWDGCIVKALVLGAPRPNPRRAGPKLCQRLGEAGRRAMRRSTMHH
jgi:hypothetical protein